MKALFFACSFVLSVVAVVAVAIAVLGRDERQQPAGEVSLGSGIPEGFDSPEACAENQSGGSALLGRLADGRSLADARAAGYEVVQAIDGMEPDLILIQVPYPAEEYKVEDRDLFETVGVLLHHSRDPDLCSSDYHLSDRPTAVELRDRAVSAIIQGGLLKREQIDAGGTTFQVSEDPTNAERLFLTVLLAGPGQASAGFPADAGLIPYVAIIDKGTGEVIGMGRAHWYDDL